MSMFSSKPLRYALGALATAGLLAACGGGADTGSDGGSAETIEPGTRFFGQVDFPALANLTSADVQLIIAQAVNEANAQGVGATIAVTDRVGNVLAVFQMNNADPHLRAVAEIPRTINQGPLSGTVLVGADGSGLDGLSIPLAAPLGAIAKAVTGAYLSSSGNAFTTRTASQIVQENFNPEETFQAGGPLFGVQFSQLACSDLSTRFESDNGAGTVVGSTVGPKRSPLGLAADPGGLPIYKNGVVVGGIGVISDGTYSLDLRVTDIDSAAEIQDELIALAGITGFEGDQSIRAFNITVEGNTLRYTDTTNDRDRLSADPATAPGFAAILGQGALLDVQGYYDVTTGTAADVLAGTAYGDPASGYVPATSLAGGSPFQNPNAFVLVDDAGNPRFSPKAAGDTPGGDVANALTQTEVVRLIDEALGVALAGRAQIRRPLNSRIQVTVSIVDTNGEILGVARTPDGPIFGTDVSLQKARTAMFFSSDASGTDLAQFPEIDSSVAFNNAGLSLALAPVGGLVPDPDGGPGQAVTLASGQSYVDAARTFVAPDALTGQIAFSDRGNGNLSRPFFPDGVQEQQNGTENPNGPFSRPFNSADSTQNWSPFSTGLQFDIVGGNILQHVLFALQPALGLVAADTPDTPVGCGLFETTGGPAPLLPIRDALAFPRPALANGAQIFAGSVPIYRNGILIGGIGVSGDGIDQDDMISSLGLRRAGLFEGNGLGHAPEAIRSDTVIPVGGDGSRLRYVSCPFEPFIDSDIQNACEDL
ncbi:MAG: heme-binding protein [Pseudomonadota bacterium]